MDNKSDHSDTRRWYHIILTTYGSWLPGDLRGFRTRDHREHVEGDYRNPPPTQQYAARRDRSRRLLKHPAIELTPAQRHIVGTALRDRLKKLGAYVVAIAVDLQHVHLQLKLPPREAMSWIGLAKKHAWFELRETGFHSGLWGKRAKVVPIKDRAHQVNVYRYIMRHAQHGAWVWNWKDDQP